MYQNAKKYFITAKTQTTVGELIRKHAQTTLEPSFLVESGGVWLEKKRVASVDEIVEKGGTIRVYIVATQGKRFLLQQHHIVFETDDFIIIHKPAGLTTSSDRSNAHYNLATSVGDWFKKLGNSYTPTPITRLDFMVEGLVLFPKHKKAEIDFFRLTQKRFIRKQYVALVEKKPGLPSCFRVKDTIDFTHRAVSDPNGKEAHTLFIKREDTETWTSYSVFLFTGRRHQIRFHASKYLNPLIGDTFYGGTIKTKTQQIGLIAYRYAFRYRGKRYKITLPELDSVLGRIQAGIV